jgi:succinate dehydrogenase/fumarate reductase cytochrome b subunit
MNFMNQAFQVYRSHVYSFVKCKHHWNGVIPMGFPMETIEHFISEGFTMQMDSEEVASFFANRLKHYGSASVVVKSWA